VKKLVAEIDRVAEFIEDLGEPWTFQVVWKLDKVSQELEEVNKKSPLTKISKNVLNQYLERMVFLSENQDDLVGLIKRQDTKSASSIYNVIKGHFGSLKKQDSIEFIKKVLNK